MCVEGMPQAEQFVAQGGIVVDLSVEDSPNRPVFVVDRLVAAAQVNDREPPHAEAHARLNEEALVVRPAMAHRSAHCAQTLFTYLPVRSVGHQAADTAHYELYLMSYFGGARGAPRRSAWPATRGR